MRVTRTGTHIYEIAREGAMRVPGRVYADESLFSQSGFSMSSSP